MEIRDKIKNIKIIHWNCNSINNKIEEFKDFIIKFNPEIVLLNETKINDFMANVIFSDFVEYDYLHKQRSSKNGAGGVSYD
jgi:exonuclease III